MVAGIFIGAGGLLFVLLLIGFVRKRQITPLIKAAINSGLTEPDAWTLVSANHGEWRHPEFGLLDMHYGELATTAGALAPP
jgi:hypothetical protein